MSFLRSGLHFEARLRGSWFCYDVISVFPPFLVASNDVKGKIRLLPQCTEILLRPSIMDLYWFESQISRHSPSYRSSPPKDMLKWSWLPCRTNGFISSRFSPILAVAGHSKQELRARPSCPLRTCISYLCIPNW